MAFWDPPHVSIRKKLPRETRLSFAAVETAVATRTELWPDPESKLAIGFVTAVWAANTAAHGGFTISNSTHRWIMDAGALCHRKLGQDRRLQAEMILRDLIDAGVVPGK